MSRSVQEAPSAQALGAEGRVFESRRPDQSTDRSAGLQMPAGERGACCWATCECMRVRVLGRLPSALQATAIHAATDRQSCFNRSRQASRFGFGATGIAFAFMLRGNTVMKGYLKKD